MATISRVHTFSTGEVLTAANLNGELNLIVSAINGNIDADNVDTSAIPTLTATQTLTNKTLTSPKIGTAVLDTAGAELIKLTATGSAVNELTIANAATGNSPTISSTGDDTNIDLTLSGKGTGKVIVSGDLQVSGDDLFMGTNTSGHVLIADGTNFNPTALSGDVTVSSSGTTAIESGVIVNADVNASAAIAQSKLALAVTTSEIAAATLVTESEGIGSNDNDTTLPTSAAVKDYVDTQILTEDTLAELNDTTIGSLASGHLLIYDGTDSWDNKAVTGDISIDSSGVTAIGSGVIVDADVNSSAAIAQSKLDLAITTSQIAAATLVTESEGIGNNDNDTTLPTSAAVKSYVDTQILTEDTLTELNDTNISSASSGQILIYDGSDSWDNKSLTGDVLIAADGTTSINSDVIVNADIKSDAAIADSKLATISTSNKVSGSAVQLASTTAIEDSSGLQIKSAIAGTGLSLSSQVLSVDAAQTQITSVGTLSSLTVGGNIVSDTDGTDDLGLTGTRWRYIYADDIAITNDLAVTEGGTGASTASAARTNLGVAIGSDVQAYDAGLADIAGLATSDGNIIVGSGSNWVAESGATARTSLGLGSMATQASDSVSITGGSVTGITDITVADGGTGSSSASGARTNLGLSIGSDIQAYDAKLAAIAGLAVTDGNIIVGNGSTWVAESAGTARTSLGLGSIATQNANAVSISGGSLTGMTSYSGGTISGTALTIDAGTSSVGATVTASTGQVELQTDGQIYGYQKLSVATAGLQIKGFSDGGGTKTQTAGISLLQTANSAAGGHISFLTHDGSSVAERAKLNSAGKFIVGTNGVAGDTFNVSNGGAEQLEIGTSSGYANFQSYNRSGAAYIATELRASEVRFHTGSSPAQAMLITSDRHVAIGTSNVPAGYDFALLSYDVNHPDAGFFRNYNGGGARGYRINIGAKNASNVLTAAARVGGHLEANDTDGYFTIDTLSGGSIGERIRVLKDGGITFNGDTATANALDEYEQGTHNPTVGCSTSGSMGLNSARNTLQYTKIGNWVNVQGYVEINTVSSGVGHVTLSMPFANQNDSEFSGISMGSIIVNATSNPLNCDRYSLFMQQGESQVRIYATDGGVQQNDSAENITTAGGADLYLNISYRTQ